MDEGTVLPQVQDAGQASGLEKASTRGVDQVMVTKRLLGLFWISFRKGRVGVG